MCPPGARPCCSLSPCSCTGSWVQHSVGPAPDASAVVGQPVQAHIASEEQQVHALQDRPAQQGGAGHMGRRLERGDDHVLQATPAVSGDTLHPAGTYYQRLTSKCWPAALTSERSSKVQTRALLHLFEAKLSSSALLQAFSGSPDVAICACQQMTHLLGVIAGVAHNVLAPTRWPPGVADMLLCIVVTCEAQRLPCCMCSLWR